MAKQRLRAFLTGAFNYSAGVMVPLPLLIGLAGLLTLLSAGSVAATILPRRQPGKWDDLGPRMQSWWVIAGLFAAALLLGPLAMTVLLALTSFLALKEFMTLAPTRREDRPVVLACYLFAIASYGLVFVPGGYDFFMVAVPIYGFMLIAITLSLTGRTEQFLATAGIMHWGMVICVFNLGHLAFLMRVPFEDAGGGGGAGLVFLILVVTQFNDVGQYVTGKRFGRRKIVPSVSPNKTWEGFIGGVLLTALLFSVLAPFFTTLAFREIVLTGLALPVAGFFGDVAMSAVKRDLGVKDTSRFIPGHGGALDRLDSLTFTAPLFFHLLAFFAVETY